MGWVNLTLMLECFILLSLMFNYKMQENVSMNCPRPAIELKNNANEVSSEKIPFSSYNEMSEKYKEQLEKNQNLERELLKNKIQMKNLEEKLNAKLEKEYSVYIIYFIYRVKIILRVISCFPLNSKKFGMTSHKS